MAIAIHCPHCQTAYRLAEDQAGKCVRCRGCRQTFDVPGGAAPAPHVGLHRLDKPLGPRPPARPALPLPTALPASEPPPRREPESRDREPEEPRDDLPLPAADNRALLGVVAAVGVAAVLVLAMCAGVLWYVFHQAGKGVDRLIQKAKQGPPAIPAETPIVSQQEALFALTSRDPRRKQRGAEWLGRQFPDPDPDQREAIRDALAPLLTDPDPRVQHAARHATNLWR